MSPLYDSSDADPDSGNDISPQAKDVALCIGNVCEEAKLTRSLLASYYFPAVSLNPSKGFLDILDLKDNGGIMDLGDALSQDASDHPRFDRKAVLANRRGHRFHDRSLQGFTLSSKLK
ncbi:hypothetical protein GA0070609_3282 [Micromonospora echinaurantiaca]|uniref:Uncharacterized protein n=1 Tax=Micromonospora echinaurantiaca TaxID=47857 RepID=A0A1C5IFR7_9ACTN|nr:hypothetical protein [Micromonospora echinaurantiaca]SCG57272.1 hypothetical protein GA0070609_3282 [Micromonospora echinaurantiaca]